jgi:hypothetical protein
MYEKIAGISIVPASNPQITKMRPGITTRELKVRRTNPRAFAVNNVEMNFNVALAHAGYRAIR